MVRLYAPSLPRQPRPLLLAHLQMVRGPVFCIPVFRDRPEHLDEPETAKMNHPPLPGDFHRTDGYIALPIRVDQAVALQPRQK